MDGGVFDLESDATLTDRIGRLARLLVDIAAALQGEGELPPAWSDLPREVLRLKTEVQTLQRKLTAVQRIHDDVWFRDTQDIEVVLRSALGAALD